MKVEVWSDVVCPWCYIGKRRLEAALAGFEHRDEVEVVWRAFELDPAAPPVHEGPPAERLAAKYGMSVEQAQAAQANLTELAGAEGLDYHLATARSGNSFDAHRLVHLAATQGRADEMKERLFAAYLEESKPIGDVDTLVGLAAEVGIDPERAASALAGEEFAGEVRNEEAEARSLGISGVPFFVIDRAYGISGAQPAQVLARALEAAWDASHPFTMVATGGDACEGDSCAV